MYKVKSKVIIGLLLATVLILCGILIIHPATKPNVPSQVVASVGDLPINDVSIYTFTVTNESEKECSIRLADKTVTRAIVPSTAIINNTEYAVTAIAPNGFANSINLEKVWLPKSIKIIEPAAFMNCKKLKTLALSAVESIGTNALSRTGLEYLILPETLTTVGSTILRDCSTPIYLRLSQEQTTNWSSNWNEYNTSDIMEYNSTYIPPVQYRYEQINISPQINPVGYNSRKVTAEGYVVDEYQPFVTQTGADIYIPAEYNGLPVIGIADMAFSYNNMNTITIAYSDTPIQIGSYAFYCFEGSTITINRDVEFKSNGIDSTFVFSSSLATTIILPDSISTIEDSLFQDCENLKDIHFLTPNSNLSQSEEQNLASSLISTQIVSLPKTVTKIGSEAFTGTTQISKIKIPNSVINVGARVFVGWAAPQSIYIDYDSESALGNGWNSLWNTSCDLSIIEYAKPQIFSITYNLDGGVHEGNPNTYTNKDSFVLKDAERTGYAFAGWYDISGNKVTEIIKGTVGDLVLDARWIANEYQIIYLSNKPHNASSDVLGDTDNSYHYYGMEEALRLNGYTLKGWIFSGWKDKDGRIYENGETVKNLTSIHNGVIVLNAQWIPQTYSISYNQGQPGGASNLVQGDKYVSSHTYDSSFNLLPNRFTLTGWTFIGWKDLQNNSYTNEQEIKNLTHEGTISLIAQWQPNNYTVTYYNNKPNIASSQITGNMVVSNHIYDSVSQLRTNTYQLRGWTFVGWNSKIDGSGKTYNNNESVAIMTTSNNIDLYAQWVQNTYSITYNSNKPIHASKNITGSMSKTNHVYDKSSTLRANAYGLQGWIFNGWNTEKDGSGIAYSNTHSVSTVTDEGNIEIYAQWIPYTYEVEYYGNGGTGTMGKSTFKYDTSYYLSTNAFKKTGYHILQWTTESNGAGTTYFPNDPVKNMTEVNGGKVKLYVQWDPNTYTIKYDPNGGTGYMADSQQEYDAPLKISKNQYTREYYGFKGWSKTPDGPVLSWISSPGSPIIDNLVESGSITLYAIWEDYYYTVRFKGYCNICGKASNFGNSPTYTMKYNESRTKTAPDSCGNSKGALTSCGADFVRWDISSDKGKSWTDSNKSLTIKNLTSTHGEHFTITAIYDATGGECVAEGTMITLADGSQKAVEKLTGNELLLVWNLKTGKFDTAPILFIDSDARKEYEVINLYFSDGTTVKVISEHAFWDIDLNQYVFLRNDAAKYIGHWFNKQTTDANGNMTWTNVQLSNVVVQQEYTTAWSPVTYGHLCYYVNGMLSMPGATEGLINIFDVDPNTMKIDETAYEKDIEKYGLFTYEEFIEIIEIPEEMFIAFNGQYLKVAIGKGLTTIDELIVLINRYLEFM